ncbi:myb-like protein X [Diachasmimorpha longicaudata]|uniref:myb-like protein X n=1 Tax=Diachasmimorpha longicaudata TaxID=58733 RepID=UPI0030B8F3D3
MEILSQAILISLNVLLLIRQTAQASAQASATSEVNQLASAIKRIDPNSPILLDENGNPRDKRALGVLLQGLVQAFGYNATPVQLASLPNPNTVGTVAAGPLSIDIRQASPGAAQAPAAPPMPAAPPASPPAAAMPAAMPAASVPRRRETLRFTGVVNFGNNSDILGHLRQYERLFHGSTTGRPPAPAGPPPAPAAAPAAAPARPPAAPARPAPAPAINPRTAQQRPPLLEPYFVPIPIPLSPNIQNFQDLQYPQRPIISFVTPNSVETSLESTTPTVIEHQYVNKEHKETKNVQSQKIIGDRNPNLDERRNNHQKIIENNNNREQEIILKNQNRPGYSDTSDEEAMDRSHEDNDQKDEREDDKEPEEGYAGDPQGEGSPTSNTEDQEEEVKEEDAGGESYNDQSQSPESEAGSEQYSQDASEEEQESPQKLPSDSTEKNELPKMSLEDAEEYVPQKYPSYYGIKLPIEEKPFQGPFMNSYGQSLENSGKIDDNVADYFQRFKNAQSGLFDAQSIITPQIHKRPWWIEGVPRDPIPRLHNDYKIPLQNKFEEYELRNPKSLKEQVTEEDEGKVGKQIRETYDKSSEGRGVKQEGRVKGRKKSEKSSKRRSPKAEAKIQEIKLENRIERKQLPLRSFDFVKYSPYYKPVQYFFSPESLQKSTQSILTDQNYERYRHRDDDPDGSGSSEESPEEQPPVTVKVDKSSRLTEHPESGQQPSEDDKSEQTHEAPANQEDFEGSSEQYSSDQTVTPGYGDSPDSGEATEDANTTPGPPSAYDYSGRAVAEDVNQEQETDPPIAEADKDYSEDSGQSEYHHESSGESSTAESEDEETPEDYKSQDSSSPTSYEATPIDEPPVTASPDELAGRDQQKELHLTEASSPGVEGVQDVRITTYNPVTYEWHSRNHNDDRQNAIPRSKIVQYEYPSPGEVGEDDGTSIPPQYLPYSGAAPVFSPFGNSPEPITPGDYLYGRRIEPLVNVRRGGTADEQNYNDDKGAEARVSERKIEGPTKGTSGRRTPKTDRHSETRRGSIRASPSSVSPSEFKSATSQRYVSEGPTGGTGAYSRGRSMGYPRYY